MRKMCCFLAAVMALAFMAPDPPAIAQSYYSPAIDSILARAGDNREELEKVLDYYTVIGDTLMIQAAEYLIANMEGHCYATFRMIDTAKNEIEFNVLDYADFKELLEAANKLEKIHGTLDFERKELIYDLQTIRADFLIENIDFAFRAWREKSWAQNLSFPQFREYVLPYRGSNEPLQSWRKIMWERYAEIGQKMKNPGDPIEAAVLINDDIKTWFHFDERYYFHPTDQGIEEMLATKLGRCEDMTNLAIYAMRANGLGVTSDYTPCWANTGNNHAWNSILAPDGRVIPFMGAEAEPGEYQLANKLAKAYRKTFSEQKNNLVFLERKQEKIPGWLAGKNYLDVTADYIPTIDYQFPLTAEIPDSIDISYLCVFNSGEWRPVDWARIEGSSALFKNIGADIAYLPAFYLNEAIVPCGPPRVPRDQETELTFPADTLHPFDFAFEITTKRAPVASTDGIDKTPLENGKEYELFYWDEGWQSLGKQTAENGSVTFMKIPSGGLYWLIADDSDHEERIFSIEDGRQVWW